jgi:large subunit ribosomal protein L32e
LHASGLKRVSIESVQSLSKINGQEEGIVVSKTVGMRKRLEILKKANEMGIQVLNINSNEHINKIENLLKQRKEKKILPKKEEKKTETKQEKEGEK